MLEGDGIERSTRYEGERQTIYQKQRKVRERDQPITGTRWKITREIMRINSASQNKGRDVALTKLI